MDTKEDFEGFLRRQLLDLICIAEQNKMVFTVELVPCEPLAMGNYEMKASVRNARVKS